MLQPDRPPETRTALKALLFEDNADDIAMSLRALGSAGFEVAADVTATPHEFLDRLRSAPYDVVLSDYRMPAATGMDMFQAMRASGVEIPFILVTGSLGDEKAVECLKEGVADYVLKDRITRLPAAIRRALSERDAREAGRSAQEYLRRSEASYRSLVDGAPYGIFRASLDQSRFLTVNPALIEMLGYESEAEVLALDPCRSVYLEGEAAREVLRKRVHGGLIQGAEVDWKQRNGTVITVQLNGRLVPRGECGPCFEMIATDISARKAAERRILQINRLYSMLKHINQASVRIGDATELMRELCRIIVEEGLFRMAWVGLIQPETRAIQPVVHWGAEDGYLSSVRISAADEPAGRGPTGIAVRTGRHYICEDVRTDPNFSPWRVAALARGYGSAGSFPLKQRGEVVGALTLYAPAAGYFDEENVALLDELAADVSFALEKIALERQRRQAVDELNHFFMLSREMLAITDLQGQILRLNPAWEKSLGYTPPEICAKPWLDLIHPQQQPEAAEAVAGFANGSGVSALELRFRAKDGSYRWLAASAAPAPERGAVYAAMHDITERKLLEDQLRRQNLALEEQNRRVHAANRMKSEFLANMSHELRSPLNGIIGFTELLYDGRVGDMAERHRELLGRILKNSTHLLRLISDVLDVSRIEAGRLELRPERLWISSVLQEVVLGLSPLAAEKKIQIETAVAPEVNEATIDPARLKQVFYNYLSNALKFTPDGGRVRVAVSPEDAVTLRIEVSDTGPGIAPENLERLFTEFQQLDSGAKKRYPGTGLGLALTKHIVEAQGGSVGVESTPGQGSTFYAILPREADQLDAAPRLLVIEDEPVQRAVVMHMLQRAGCVVDFADSCAVALVKARACAFDAITMDLILPDATGWKIMDAIRSTEPNRQTPVILISEAEEGKSAAGRNVQEVVSKPVRRDELLAALGRIGVATKKTTV